MKSREILKAIGKMAITGCSMVAVNEVIGYHANPYKSATGTRLACNIAGYSIGFVVGRHISDEIVDFVDDILIHGIGQYAEGE